jgi:nucleoside 2-deoxyribosyltransferase
MKLYLAGPMRGYKDFNFPAFDAAAAKLRAVGLTVFNPADHDRDTMAETNRTAEELTIRECMKADTGWICDHAEGIALLPGWEASTGAQAELALAKALGIPYGLVEDWVELHETYAPSTVA